MRINLKIYKENGEYTPFLESHNQKKFIAHIEELLKNSSKETLNLPVIFYNSLMPSIFTISCDKKLHSSIQFPYDPEETSFSLLTKIRYLTEIILVNPYLTDDLDDFDPCDVFFLDSYGFSLAKALTENKNVTSIDLSNNGLSPKGANQLLSLLKKDQTIKNLNLEGAFGDTSTITLLIEVIKQNKTLERFSLSVGEKRKISVTWLEPLKLALKTNDSLKELTLSRYKGVEENFLIEPSQEEITLFKDSFKEKKIFLFKKSID